MQNKIVFVIILGTGILLNSCKKKIDTFTSPSLTEYYPLQPGKYITYQLDSTVFVSFGTRDTVITYQVQDRVDAQITDNTGRPAYRIIRFIRKNASQPWTPGGNTFMVVPLDNSIEVVENNLRYIKLQRPLTEGFTWKGNRYLPSDAFSSFDFSSDFTDDWDYTYDSVNAPLALGSLNFDSTIKVEQMDYVFRSPKDTASKFAERTYAVEKYSKGIGLVYKEFLHWEYQRVGDNYKGFGIKLSIIDHN